MNLVLETFFKHKSIRKYKNQPLEDEKLQLIIKAAQAGPTRWKVEQVSLIAIKSQEIKDLCWGTTFISTCSVFLVFCAGFYPIKVAFEKSGKTIWKVYTKHRYTYNRFSWCLNCYTKCHGCCWIYEFRNCWHWWVRLKPLEITKSLNLPKYVIPLIGPCMGYRDDNPGIRPRIPPKGVCFENKYDTELAKAGVDEYDEIYKKYCAERETNAKDIKWSNYISDIYTKITTERDY